MLTQLLTHSNKFQQLPLDKQDILIRLAHEFQSNPRFLYLSPVELADSEEGTGIGNQSLWQDLLSLEETRVFIKNQMAHQTQIAQRKAFLSLQAEAIKGSVQAAREINELSGIMDRSDNNRIVVLHRISRPSTKENQNQEVK